ncbi:hypothetical protein [Aquabacterium sp.]|uniref:hypothetical protein n=1 Tax=Aquabacterium sp. TaxID=1872578 RepID=UPI0025C6C19D|nr:hypothetical protein [Aquabacterium sp.]
MRSSSMLTWARPAMIALVAFSLLTGIAGGLMRAGVPVIGWLPANWVLPAASLHAALMVCGFLGTVIGIERAVALHAPWAFLAPLASALGGVCLMSGLASLGVLMMVLASVVFVLVNVFIVGRQTALHTCLLLVSALIWLLGNVRFAHHGLANGTLLAWLGFLVLTIAAERLEMTRLMRVRSWSRPLLGVCLALLLAGIVLAEWQDQAALLLWGLGLVALSGWLISFDIARHTIKAEGLSRYMAACLLLGYVWLGVSGLCWVGMSMGLATRDAALHALGLGFIVSMVMGHAPVILPAVARIKLHFDARFYLPLALLHASVLWRLLAGHNNATWLALGSTLNAVAIAAFALTVVSAAWSWRQRHP